MKAIVDYWEIERRYRIKGDNSDNEFCVHAGIMPSSYKSRRSRKCGMSLIVALLIADYLGCNITDFCSIRW